METRRRSEENVAALPAVQLTVTVRKPAMAGVARAPLVARASALQHLAEPRPRAVRDRPEAVPSEALDQSEAKAAREPSKARPRSLEKSWP